MERGVIEAADNEAELAGVYGSRDWPRRGPSWREQASKGELATIFRFR
jgi:hypothetical protein